MFKDYDMEMIWSMVQYSDQREWYKDEVIFQQNDIADSFYLIYRGEVKMVGKTGQKFMTYKQGETIGDSDALLGEPRDCKAIAESNQCVMY